jgi:hypothetical protein
MTWPNLLLFTIKVSNFEIFKLLIISDKGVPWFVFYKFKLLIINANAFQGAPGVPCVPAERMASQKTSP